MCWICQIKDFLQRVKYFFISDNISITIDSCVYYHIENPHLAQFRMNNLVQSVTKIAGGIIKNTVAQFTFQ